MSSDNEINNLELEINNNKLNTIVIKGPEISEFNDNDNNLLKGLFLLILVSSLILFLIYSIIFLVLDKNESNLCDNLVWNYNLSLLILFFVLIMLQYFLSKDKSNVFKKFYEVLFGIIWIGIGIFGIIIVKQEDCDEMKTTKLLEFTNVISIIVTIFGSVMFLDGILKLIYFYEIMNDK